MIMHQTKQVRMVNGNHYVYVSLLVLACYYDVSALSLCLCVQVCPFVVLLCLVLSHYNI